MDKIICFWIRRPAFKLNDLDNLQTILTMTMKFRKLLNYSGWLTEVLECWQCSRRCVSSFCLRHSQPGPGPTLVTWGGHTLQRGVAHGHNRFSTVYSDGNYCFKHNNCYKILFWPVGGGNLIKTTSLTILSILWYTTKVVTIIILSTCHYSPRACMLVATPCLIIYNSHTITVEMVRSKQVRCSAARLTHVVLLTVAQLHCSSHRREIRKTENITWRIWL